MEKNKKRCFMKFAWRHNLIYPIFLLLWILLRRAITFLLSRFFNFSKNILFTLLMFFGEFSTCLIIYFYQKRFLKNKNNNSDNEDTKNSLIFNGMQINTLDSNIKIGFLIFVSAYFDFVEFNLSTNYIPKFPNSSGSLDLRLGGILTIISALFFHFLLKLPILRHQFFSLYIIALCFFVSILLEYYFQDVDIFINYLDLSFKILFIIIEQFFHALLDSIEKYVVEYNNLNYFKVLTLEGFFGAFITSLYFFIDDSFVIQLKEVYNEKSGTMFALFIFLLFLYIVLCGLKNAYRVITNKIYSPMTKSLTDYFLNPLFLIQNYIEGDFKHRGKQNFFYFFISFILGITTDLFGSVFNEIIILFFCDLEVNTHDQVSYRSILDYQKELSELKGPIEDYHNNYD